MPAEILVNYNFKPTLDMLPIAGQTARPNRLNFYVDTHGEPVCLRLEKSIFSSKFFLIFFPNSFFSRATPGSSASI